MKPVTLKEFRSVSLISEEALVWLLERNALPISMDAEKGIMVDMAAVETEKLIQALVRERKSEDAANFNLMTEQAGKIIRDNFDTIIEAAITRLNQK